MNYFFTTKKIAPTFSSEKCNDYFNSLQSKNRYLCNAPFSGIYFTPNGIIKPCCASTISYGDYNSENISTALESKNRKTLIRHMKKNNLDYGCYSCLKNIDSGNYHGSISSLYLKYQKGAFSEVIDFELSHFCNLNCIMCTLHTNESEMNEIYGNHFLEEIMPYLKHAKSTRFYGGEPFLIKQYYKIWDAIKKVNPHCHVHIQTNATIYNQIVEKTIGNLDSFIGVSLDAFNPILYEKIRKGAVFNEAIENVYRFNNVMKSQGKPLSISVCPMPINIDEIIKIYDFANTLEANLFFNTVDFPTKYSLEFCTSMEIQKWIKLMNKSNLEIGTSSCSINNYQRMIQFISYLNYLFEKNLEIEKNQISYSLLDFLLSFKKRNIDFLLVDSLIELSQSVFDMSEHVNIYLMASINKMNTTELSEIIKQIILKNDSDYLHKIFDTNCEI